ncbi:MAG: bifunctional oligoribonuclease/PAP phosphatase NrnA [Bacteroidales bacterium]|nr:bifunctional oligoribonuclease/PAP phosphatase NrnA [Bacteroidota bacterium]MBL6950547.1 bifunctional oligoribonuclease/PAP phosphatase NrnA [Bacteroidales bacterium]
MERTGFKQVRELLSRPQTILLTIHTNPDGDAIGSALALYWYLMKKGHTVFIMSPDPFPAFLAWMDGQDRILIFSREEEKCLKAIADANVIFSLDYNDFNRLKKAMDPVMKSNAKKVLLDHHLYPADHYDLKISIEDTSSTAELVFDFIEAAGDTELIDQAIASSIYTGIVTDTGSFSYSCNDERTYLVIASLFQHGIDGEHIHRLVYDTFSENRLRLLGYSLSEKLVVLQEFHTAYIYLTTADLERFNYQIGDMEGVVNYALSIEGINLAALFSERDNSIRISFRSKGNFSVEQLARDHFDGGGHPNAAGATSYLTMDETLKMFLETLPIYREALNKVYS